MIIRSIFIASLFIIVVAFVRERDQRQISQAEHRYRRLFDALADPVFVQHDGVIIEVNPAFERSFQYPAAEITGRPVSDLVVFEQKDDPASGVSSHRFEFYIICKDGHHLPVEISSKSYLYQDQWMQVTTARDLSARFEAEAALESERAFLRSVIDHIPAWIYVKDTDSRFVLTNRAFQHVFGTDLIGRNDYDLFEKDDADRFFNQEQHLFQTAEAVEMEAKTFDENGEDQWLTVNKVPLYDTNGRITRMLGINTDITSRKKLENHLRYHAELIDNIADAIISTDMDLHIVSWNQGAEHMYGWTSAEVMGSEFRDIIKHEFFDNATRDSDYGHRHRKRQLDRRIRAV